MPSVGTTHHVKLGTEFLIIRPNSYQKRAAPTFGARIATGDPDYNNLSIWQHWVQKCWIGGMDADEWVDDAMFDEAIGIDSTVHEQARLARDLDRGSGSNWDLGGSANTSIYRSVIFGGSLYIFTVNGTAAATTLWQYNAGTDGWDSIALPANIVVMSVAAFDGKMYIGGRTTGSAVPVLYWATAPGTWNSRSNPAGVPNGGVTAMKQFNGKLYVAYLTYVWREKDDQTWDGSTVFYKVNANSGSNEIVTMEMHLGSLYLLSRNGHIHKTDGNNSFDIWAWDNNTIGKSLRSFDGKLFVQTFEYLTDVNIGFSVMYQFTGSAVTELKRWGKVTRSTLPGQMVVFGRKLYYGASDLFGLRNGFGVAVYDAVEDAHSIWATNTNTATYTDSSGTGKSWIVDEVIVFGGKLFCTSRRWGAFTTVHSFRDYSAGVSVHSTDTNGGILTSSQYDGGTPGLQKLWRKITVYMTLPNSSTSFSFSYSTDGGATYTGLTAQVGPSPSHGQYTFFLSNIRSSRFKWRITLKSTDITKTPTLRAVVVAYLPQPEPNWMWSFTVPVADKWELMDGTNEVKSTNALIAYFEALYRAQVLTTFIDLDGAVWATNGPGVLIYDMSVVHYDVENPREADLRITLLETVETY